MGEIYNLAKNVIIWLGEPQPGVKWAFRRTHNLHRLEIVKQMLELVGGPIKEVEWGLRQLVCECLNHPFIRTRFLFADYIAC